MAIAELRSYLDMWKRQGQLAADAKYVIPEQRVTTAAEESTIKSASIVSYRVYSRTSINQFVLFVEMDIKFGHRYVLAGGGDGLGAFVTFSRPTAQTRYLMSFATGP